MILKQQMADDLSRFFNTEEFAETVNYNGSNVIAIFAYKRDLDAEGNDTTMAKGILIVRASDVANPTYRDTVIVNSVTWRVRDIEYGDGFIWKLNLYRDERPIL